MITVFKQDGTLPYDISSKDSIYHYAIKLRGSTLRESSDAEEIANITQRKGSFGDAIEYHYFHLDNNSISAPDFSEAGLELKTTPLKRNKSGNLSAKERLVIGMIDYSAVVHESFETSHFKEKAENITRRILGVSDDAKIEEFEKAGIKPKTMRIKRNGTPKESVSFPHFDYFELAKTSFEDSDFAEYLNQKYLFVVYREDEFERDVYRLADVAFWQMPENDLEEAKRCYEEMRRRVASGHAQDSVKSSENRCCHVRPHGRNNNDTLPTPQGDRVVKKCFWLNAQYLKDEIAKLLGS